VTAYGDIGIGRMSSRFGSSGVSPYADDDAAKTTRRTPLRRATSSTVTVPPQFTASDSIGVSTLRGTEPSAA
jgi:hypothetical protein